MSKAVKDKWRRKEWYDIILPRYFGETKVGETPAEEEALLNGRVFETTLAQITGDFSQEYIKMYFQVTGVEDHKATTVFKGHEYLRDYLRSLVRRRSTKVDGIYRVTTTDGYKVKIIVTAMTQVRIKSSQEHEIRAIMKSDSRREGEDPHLRPDRSRDGPRKARQRCLQPGEERDGAPPRRRQEERAHLRTHCGPVEAPSGHRVNELVYTHRVLNHHF